MYWILLFELFRHSVSLFAQSLTICPEEHFTVRDEEFIWPETPVGDSYIVSDCLDTYHLLVARQCLKDVGWSPNEAEIRSIYKTKMPASSVEMCHDKLGTVRNTDICFYWVDPAYVTGSACAGFLSIMHLSMVERTLLMGALEKVLFDELVYISVKNAWPNKAILPGVDYTTENIELQATNCGGYGLPIQQDDNIYVNTSHLAEEMHLYLKPESLPEVDLILGDSNYLVYGVYAYRYTAPLQTHGCPEGYFRPDAWLRLNCLAIKFFPEPISVTDIVDLTYLIVSSCDQNIMIVNDRYDIFKFMQLAEQARLSEWDVCLTGIGIINQLIRYSDWPSSYPYYREPWITWDRNINYSRILTEKSFLSFKSNGEMTWATDAVTCIVCSTNIPRRLGVLRLMYSSFERKLELSVTNQEFFYRQRDSHSGVLCFAVVEGIYKTNLTIHPIPNTTSQYLVDNVGCGQYWCSGHTIGYESAISKTDVIYAFATVFVFWVKRSCWDKCSYNSNDIGDLVQIVASIDELLKVVNTPHSQLVDVISSTQYTFIAHLGLSLNYQLEGNFDKNFLRLTDYEFETFVIHDKLQTLLSVGEFNETKIISITSTEYCLHKSIVSIDSIIWGVSYMNETIFTSQLCPRIHASEIFRNCSGDSVYGATWHELVNAPECYSSVSELLVKLYNDLRVSNESSNVIKNLTIILQDNENWLPIDVYVIAHIIGKISNLVANNQSCFTFEDAENILSIYNSLMSFNSNILQTSTILNSTNILLATLDDLLLDHIEANVEESYEYMDTGISSIHRPSIINVVLNPMISGVSGIALYEPDDDSDSDDLRNLFLRYIYPNETTQDLFMNKNLVIGSYVPKEILSHLKNIQIVLTIFFNDTLFKSASNRKLFTVNGKVISITIIGSEGDENLPQSIPIFFEYYNSTDEAICGYWSFPSEEGWSPMGCILGGVFIKDFQKLVLCECSHLTHFGYLITSDIKEQFEIHHEHTLTIITLIGSSISLVSILGIYITALTFRSWREKVSSKILMHISATIVLQMLLMVLINFDHLILPALYRNTLICILLGSIFHYSVLAMFSWMFIIAYFQFKRYVVVFQYSISHMLVKSTIVGWGIPIFPVIIVLVTDYSLYVPVTNDRTFCYPTGYALYFGVIAPIAVIFLFDFVVLIAVVTSLNNQFKSTSHMSKKAKIKMRLSQVRLSVFLFFTLGMNWIFGFLSGANLKSDLIFSYLFCITATVQGLVLFLYFVVFDPVVRNLWFKLFENTGHSI